MSCSIEAIVDTDRRRFVLATFPLFLDTLKISSLTFELLLRHESLQSPIRFVLMMYPLRAERMITWRAEDPEKKRMVN